MKVNGFIILFSIFIISCENLTRKGRNLITKSKTTINNKSQDLLNKVFPQFDSDKPDTKFNKERFQEYLAFTPDESIHNIYTYGDFLGADYKVLITFNCDTITLQKIIDNIGLEQIDSLNDGLLFSDELPWWNKDVIKDITPFRKGSYNEDWIYLWYDTINQKAYFQQFSL